MKKECASVRKSLRRYLTGHIFKTEQVKIERHLRSCVMCYTEYQSLKRVVETQQFLKDITPPEGVVQRVRVQASRMSGLTRLLYRPLLLALIVAVAALLYIYVINPFLHDPDIERLDAGAPAPEAASQRTVPPPAAPAPAPRGEAAAVREAPHPDPFVITLVVEQEKRAMQQMNDAMKEHAVLRTKRFTEGSREITGQLTVRELETFFAKISHIGKLRFSRARLESYAGGEMVPFVIALKTAPAAAAAPSGVKPVDKPGDNPVESPAGNGVQNSGAPPAQPAP